MQYNVAQLLLEPTGSTRSFSIEQAHRGSSDIPQSVQGAQGSVRMLRTHQGILVRALLDLEASLNCSRCLSDYGEAFTIDIEEEFIPQVDLHTGRDVATETEDDATFQIDGDHVLDLTEAVRQYAIAGEPMKPLCKQDCSGLCQSCGTNLNLSKCDCQGNVIDSRWESLAKLASQTED